MEGQVPSFEAYITVPVWGIILVPVLIWVWRFRDGCSSFLLLATWFRYCVASFHQYTYQPIIFGISFIALTAVATIAIGVIVAGGHSLRLRRLTPFYAMIVVVLISAVVNQAEIGGINASLKWLYLVVFTLAAYDAIQRHGSERIFRALAVIFVGPIALQWMSALSGLSVTTSDRQTFFIGGYQHQQELSIILLTFLFITCLSTRLSLMSITGRLVVVVAGLSLANYRTALVAAGLPAASLIMSQFIRKVVPSQRAIAFVLASIITALLLVSAADIKRERFGDIGIIWDRSTALIQPPKYFTLEERLLLSSRPYLWSQYITSYLEGDIRNAVVGFGPESWVGRFSTYAHNTFVSYLYEMGILGVGVLGWVFISNLHAALRVAGAHKFPVVACHIGFIILNLSTMGLWTLEGAMLYGLVLAYTWCLQPIGKGEKEPELGGARLPSSPGRGPVGLGART